MRLSKKRWTELARQSNYFGEQAALLYLDGRFELALDAANRALDASGELHRRDRDDREVADVHADGLRNRAEIQSAWVRTPGVWATPAAGELIRGGIADATAALDLYEALAPSVDRSYPTRNAEIRLMLSELRLMAGAVDAAGTLATASIGNYRRHREPGDRSDDLSFAQALHRYADVVAGAGQADAALAARRESVELSRPHAGPDGWLWTTRFDRGLIWLSTPTLERFCRTASLLAEQLGPADASTPTAAEAMRAWQDAAEGHAGLIRHTSLLLDPHLEHLWRTSDALKQLAGWLHAIGEPALADSYETTRLTLATRHNDWHDLVVRLRTPLDEAIGRIRPPGE